MLNVRDILWINIFFSSLFVASLTRLFSNNLIFTHTTLQSCFDSARFGRLFFVAVQPPPQLVLNLTSSPPTLTTPSLRCLLCPQL